MSNIGRPKTLHCGCGIVKNDYTKQTLNITYLLLFFGKRCYLSLLDPKTMGDNYVKLYVYI